jgi:hypothetical protein
MADEIKNLNLDGNPENLVYKTMPKGYVPPQVAKAASKPQNVAGVAEISPLLNAETADAGSAAQSFGLVPAGASFFSRFSKKTLIIAGLAGGVVLLLLIIFIFSKIFSKPAAPTPVLQPNPAPLSQNQQTAVQPSPQAQPNPVPLPQSQIPDAWRTKFFGVALCTNQDVCGDSADPDHDGLTNLQEYAAGTDPNNPDSSGSGIADGDKVHIFNLDPLSNHTAGMPKFTDAGDLKYKYNSHSHQPFTDAELLQIAANIKKYGLHLPTTTTLTPDIINFYSNYGTTSAGASSGASSGSLDRDTQRSNAIKQISYALLKYNAANQSYPDTSDFQTMVSLIKPLLAGQAVNPVDPTNVAPYIYTYQSIGGGADFQIGYYSETQKQSVIMRSADAQKYMAADQASQRDTKRVNDLQSIASALLLYSTDQANPTNPQQRVFPLKATWKQSISPKYMAIIPVDPQTNQDYSYDVSVDNASYSLQANLENPPTGKTTYLCTQDSCDYN